MGTTRFAWDYTTGTVAYTRDGDEAAQVYLGATTRPDLLVSLKRGDEYLYYHGDGNESVAAITNEQGVQEDSFVYSAFGEIVASSTTASQPFDMWGARHAIHLEEVWAARFWNGEWYSDSTGRDLSPGLTWGPEAYANVLSLLSTLHQAAQPVEMYIYKAWGENDPQVRGCGTSIGVPLTFRLNQKNPCPGRGFFVQELKNHCVEMDCYECEYERYCPPRFPPPFVQQGSPVVRYQWEVFVLQAGQEPDEAVGHEVDEFSTHFDANMCKTEAVTGVIKFFCEDQVGNLETEWRPVFQAICRKSTGFAPSTMTEPWFWRTLKPLAWGARKTQASSVCCPCKEGIYFAWSYFRPAKGEKGHGASTWPRL